MGSLIFHIDVNSAFLSWEAARRVKNGEPDLREIPSAIGGDKDKRTGIILAKSIPAKKFDVRTGEPVSMALRKCPELVLAKADFKLYTKCSRAFLDICREYAPVVEQFSIDECFLDMSNTRRIYPDPIATAYEIKDKIRDTLGFTVNVGIGTNKLLAKMASDFEKPDKVHTLFPEEIPEKMWPLPIGDLFGVGKATAEKLRGAGIETIGNLAARDPDEIRRLVGLKLGTQLHRYANGVGSTKVSDQPRETKGFSISTTLESNVTEETEARKILTALCDSVAARMRADGKFTCCVGVTIRGTDFKDRSHQRKLNEPTDITREIIDTALTLFHELWDGKKPLRLLGVSLTDLSDEGFQQMSLLDDGSREKGQQLDKAVDSLRNRYGKAMIGRASAMNSDIHVGRKYEAKLEADAEEQENGG